MIREAQPTDAAGICAVYNPYVLGTKVTFEEQALTPEAMRDRIIEITAVLPWLVVEEDGEIAAYAFAAPWKGIAAYRYSVGTTIYVADQWRRTGRGTKIYRALIERLREREIHCALAGILLPNPGSVALHEALGFKKAAHFHQVGWKFEQWIDVGYWQLSL